MSSRKFVANNCCKVQTKIQSKIQSKVKLGKSQTKLQNKSLLSQEKINAVTNLTYSLDQDEIKYYNRMSRLFSYKN